MRFIQRLRMPGLLSFPPDMGFFHLRSLNVLIGPNGSGKSNFIETLELLRATPSDFAAAIRGRRRRRRVAVEGRGSEETGGKSSRCWTRGRRREGH